MDKITHCINHNRFIPVDTEELTALELIGKTVEKTNEVVEKSNNHEDRITENEKKKVSFDDMKNKYKHNDSDFVGSWHGIERPEYSEPGIAGVVVKHTEQLEHNMYKDSILDYKKDTDLTLDDAVQRALNEGKKTIFFPSGETILTRPLIIPYGVTFEGVGKTGDKKSTIICNGNIFSNDNQEKIYLTFKNLALKGATKKEKAISGNIGLQCNNVTFENFDYAIDTINSFNSDFEYCSFTGNNVGIRLSVANRILIEKCYFSQNGVHIDTGATCFDFIIQHNVINQSSVTTQCVIFNGGGEIKNNYFEGFGVDQRKSFIDYELNKFANSFFVMEGNTFECHAKVDSVITAHMKTDQTSGVWNGKIDNNTIIDCNNLLNVDGNSSFRMIRILNNSINNVKGNITTPNKPLFSARITEGVVAASSVTTIPIDDTKIIVDNFNALSENTGGVRIKRGGLYRINLNVCISSTINRRGIKVGLYISSNELISNYVNIPVIDAGNNYTSATLSLIENLEAGTNLYLKITGECTTGKGNIIVELVE